MFLINSRFSETIRYYNYILGGHFYSLKNLMLQIQIGYVRKNLRRVLFFNMENSRFKYKLLKKCHLK